MKSVTLFDLVLLTSMLGSGIVAGVFFIFSVCIMKVLGAQPAAQGIATMQAINVVIISPWFLSVFVGTALSGAYLFVAVLASSHGTTGILALAGSVAYVAGSFLVTMAFNVPRNDALAALEPGSAAAATLWTAYLSSWTAWNHVRTVASVLGTALFGMALWLRS